MIANDPAGAVGYIVWFVAACLAISVFLIIRLVRKGGTW